MRSKKLLKAAPTQQLEAAVELQLQNLGSIGYTSKEHLDDQLVHWVFSILPSGAISAF